MRKSAEKYLVPIRVLKNRVQNQQTGSFHAYRQLRTRKIQMETTHYLGKETFVNQWQFMKNKVNIIILTISH